MSAVHPSYLTQIPVSSIMAYGSAQAKQSVAATPLQVAQDRSHCTQAPSESKYS